MARRSPSRRQQVARPVIAAIAGLAVVALGLLAISRMLPGGAGQLPSASNTSAVAGLSSRAPASSSGSGLGGGVATTGPTRTHLPTALPRGEATASPTASGTRAPRDGAPNRPSDFDIAGQQIDIGFPLRVDTRYQYRDNFLDPRDGSPATYNHARVNGDGSLLRLHDGIDIYANEGEPLVAPFSGTVVDPSTRWRPWEPSRYGRTVVIVSDERTSEGYIGLFAHVDSVWVTAGEHVTRGQVVGTLGRTGNAETESIRAHLHFELRAPFLLDWSPIGLDGVVDAFNPYPSLVAADPKRE
jgi:murein DD-endopeptidase MepM/ murein hydrolase activator NlpD